MRRKALLVGARASFVGPWVHLEKGEWVVDPTSPFDGIYLEIAGEHLEVDTSEDKKVLLITGPCKVRALVPADYEGNGVHLDIGMTAHG